MSYFVLHLGIGISCLCPATYHFIATSTITPDSCSINDVVDLELKDLILPVSYDKDYNKKDVSRPCKTHFTAVHVICLV